MYGGAGVQAMWEEKVRVAQEVADRKAKESEEFSKKLDDERKKKQKVRVEYYNTVKTEIKEVEKVINSKCEIDPKVPELLNKAATNPEKAK
jgi:D-ribose pyranose/furanose isomerase RbsD